MSFTVETPSQSFNGKRGGIYFRNGKATFTDSALVEVFEDLGYVVTKPEAPKPQAKRPAARKKRDAE